MASLSFIMDVNDDHPPGARSPLNKRARAAKNLASAGPLQETPPNPEARPKHVTDPGPATTQQDINQAAPVGSTKRRGTSSRGLGSAAAPAQVEIGPGTQDITTTSSSTPSSPPPSGSTTRKSTRQRSTTSSDSMDRSRYGSAASPSSMPRGPQRPMPLHPVTTQYTPKITPKTGRVSKAKKGLPVHICDICRPPKTFTRAEHLRRHQLGHGEPQFQCPGCDRAFHRADLLVRHQEKHKHDGDDLSKAGSPQNSPRPSSAGLPFQPQRSSPTPSRPIASPAATETPRTPNVNVGNQPGFSHTSQDFRGGYPFPPTISIVNPAQSSSLSGAYHDELSGYQPRAGQPPSICVVTHGPQFQSDMPELPDASPLPSSASDSTTYSTPVSDVSRNPRPWARHRSPYPSAAPRGLPSSGPGLEASPSFADSSFMNPYSDHRQATDSTFDGTLTVPSSLEYTTASAGHHHPPLSATSNGTIRAHQHQHSNSISSLRGQTPPMDASSHGPSGPIYASASHLPRHLDPAVDLDRRKGLLHHDLLDSHVAMDLGLSVGYAAASPGTDNASHSSDLVPELDLAFIGGCALPGPPSITIPLPGPVRAAIPRYIEVYWAQVDPIFPFIHYQSFQAGSEDVLKCAMAAVATQHLDNREDRTRGNQLHEFAWQEVKRIPQWSLQTMQAILLCEYFARFRGRKAVTRPSKPFESLYSRVLSQNTALLDHALLAAEQQRLPSLHDRWRSWVDTESRRRLLATCVFVDGHAAIYQQQRRSQDAEVGGAMQPIPLLGRTTKPWEATSVEEWANAATTDPGSLEPEHVPPLEHLTREDVTNRTPTDRIIILSVLAQRLPRRQRPPPTSSISANNSPAPELDPHSHHFSNQFHPDQHHLQHQPHQYQTPHHTPQQHHHQQQHYDPSETPTTTPYPHNPEDLISTLFPHCPTSNTYLALHHTPLRDLLAVGGDSWVFSQKVLPATSFHEHQKRLRLWVTVNPPFCTPSGAAGAGGVLAGLSVLRATVYAARAVLAFLGRQSDGGGEGEDGGGEGSGGSRSGASWSEDMSDYWAMYVCALICWAFTYPARGGAADGQGQGQGQGQSGAGGGGGSSRGRSASGAPGGSAGGGSGTNSPALTPNGAAAVASDEEAIGWLRLVAAEGVRLEDVVRVRGRREAFGVVGLVRKKLESDCVGGRSRLYVDAVGVLRKLEEGLGLKWF